MTRVLVITYYWPPSGGAGVQRWLKLAKYLPDFDIEPIILTVDPESASYPVIDQSLLDEQGDIEVHRTKSFEILKIYGRLFGKANVPYSGFSNVGTEGFLSKISRYIRGNFFIPDARKGWNKYAFRKAKDLIETRSIDIVITTGPPHSTHMVGLGLKRDLGVRWIADFRDPWTDIYYYNDLLLSDSSKKRDLKLETQVLNNADNVLAVCPSNLALFQDKLSNDQKGKLHLVTNGFDEDDIRAPSANSSDVFNIVYTGTIAPSYNIIPVLESLKELKFDWKLNIAGNIYPDLKSWFEKEGIISKLNFHGYVDHSASLEILSQGHLLLHVLPDTEKNKYGTTGKLFEYIGSGIPILNIGPEEGDAAVFIADSNSGKTFGRDDQKGILEFINEVKNGNMSVVPNPHKFSRKRIAQSLAEYLLRTFE